MWDLNIPPCPLCNGQILKIEAHEKVPTRLVYKNRRIVGRTRTDDNTLEMILECETYHRFRVSGTRETVRIKDGKQARVL